MKIAIAMAVKNCLDYTKACIDSIRTKHEYDLIVVDDGSSDGTIKWLHGELRDKYQDRLHTITDLDDDAGLSLAGKWNMAMDLAANNGIKAVLICNNDILFHWNTIDALVDRMEAVLASGENIAIVSAANMRGQVLPEELDSVPVPDTPSEADHPDFSCFLLSTEAWESVGGFDPNYVPCYFEDNDFHLALATQKLRAVSTTAAPYYHFGSVTQNDVPGGACKSPMFVANAEYFEYKWGFNTTDPRYQKLVDSARD